MILRYNPRDVTTVYVYQLQDNQEVFLTGAHAMGWETETLSYREAQALSERRRAAGKAIDSESQLAEVWDREQRVKQVKRQQVQRSDGVSASPIALPPAPTAPADVVSPVLLTTEPEVEVEKPKKAVPYVRVMDYEEMRRKAGLL